MQAIDRFRANEHGILVATDVAARGLDIPGVRTVVHYQLPHSAEVNLTFKPFFHVFFIIFMFFNCIIYCVLVRFMFIEVDALLELLLMGAVLL